MKLTFYLLLVVKLGNRGGHITKTQICLHIVFVSSKYFLTISPILFNPAFSFIHSLYLSLYVYSFVSLFISSRHVSLLLSLSAQVLLSNILV